jgi:flagellar biosynthetic protein FliP
MSQPFLNNLRLSRLTLVVLLMTAVAIAMPQQLPMLPKVTVGLDTAKGTGDVASTLQILALLTVLSIAPAILILTTAFTRIIIVFSFVRSALGTPTIPPNQVVIGLSLFLTFFVMGPTYKRINEEALQPYLKHSIKMDVAVDRASKPMREFMLRNTYKKDLSLFLNIRHERPQTRDDVSLLSLIPAFIISELKTAFIIGFYIFIPFLIIDLIVASALMSMGMMMMPPTIVALPAKLLVFVLADGWGNLVSALVGGYR